MREPGFYWVEERGKLTGPYVAEWHVNLSGNGHWHITNFEDDIEDVGFEVLSERLTPPERLFEVGLQCSNHLVGCLERCPNCLTPPGQTLPPGQPR